MNSQSGFYLLDKDPGISSARAIAQLKKKLKIEKIGHAGTLDPFATGLLIVLTGRATKLASFAAGGEKRYRAIFRFGISTDSDDCTGKITEVCSKIPTREQIEQVLSSFQGEIEQRPPQISAVKIDGKRAYKRARKGEDFTTKLRTVTISAIEIIRCQGNDIELLIQCSSGTYIRSLARDMGKMLGTVATVLTLRRELSVPFDLSRASTISQIEQKHLISWDAIFPRLQRVPVSTEQAQALERGDQRVFGTFSADLLPATAQEGELIIFQLSNNNASLGLFEFNDHRWILRSYIGE